MGPPGLENSLALVMVVYYMEILWIIKCGIKFGKTHQLLCVQNRKWWRLRHLCDHFCHIQLSNQNTIIDDDDDDEGFSCLSFLFIYTPRNTKTENAVIKRTIWPRITLSNSNNPTNLLSVGCLDFCSSIMRSDDIVVGYNQNGQQNENFNLFLYNNSLPSTFTDTFTFNVPPLHLHPNHLVQSTISITNAPS